MNDNYICTDKEYNRGILLNEFKGEYSIVAAYEKKDGGIGVDFGVKKLKDKEVPLPLAGKLGGKKQAADILRTMLAMLDGSPAQDEDEPF